MASDAKNGAKFAERIANQNGYSENDVHEKELLENNFSLDNRLKRKAKRPSKLPSADENGVANVVNVNGSYLRYSKNSRRSRNGFGRGLPKKGKYYFVKTNYILFKVKEKSLTFNFTYCKFSVFPFLP